MRVAVRDVARAQLEAALSTARGAGTCPDTVHELRMHCKKLRALLRLVRDGLRDDYAPENAAFRDAAGLLAPLRDAEVVLRTHETLLSSFGGAIDVPAAEDVRARLRARVEGADAAALIAGVIERLEEARERVSRWHLHGSDARTIYRGLKRTYRRAQRTRAAALGSTDPRHFHEWRKRVKYHWYQLRLVSALCSGRLDARARQIDRLGKLLGHAHDLAVYEHYLRDIGGRSPPADLAALLALSAYRRDALQGQALEESDALFAEKAKTLFAALVP